jgi:hypothetical protein
VNKQRLHLFEKSLGQRQITDTDKYLYKAPESTYKLVIIGAGTGTIGQEHMYAATLLGRGSIHGTYDSQIESMDVALLRENVECLHR